MAITAAAVAAVAVSAISTGLQASGAMDPNVKDPMGAGGGPATNDPLISSLSQDAMIRLGIPPDLILAQQGSPFSSAYATFLNSSSIRFGDKGLVTHDMALALEAMIKGEDPMEAIGNPAFMRAMASTIGMTLDQLFQAQQEFTMSSINLFGPQIRAAMETKQARYDAMQQQAGLIRDLPDVGAGAIEELRGQEYDRLIRDLNRSVDEASGSAMRQANFANYNPGRVLGDLEEARIRGTQDADIMALESALGLLGGQQNLAISRSTLLDSYLGGPEAYAAQLAAIRAGTNQSPTVVQPQQVIPRDPRSFSASAGQFSSGLMDLASIYAAGSGTTPTPGVTP